MGVLSWLRANCFSQMEQIVDWCRQNKKFKGNHSTNQRNNNRRSYAQQQSNNIKFYRHMPPFEDKNRNQKMNEWKKWAQNKVNMNALNNTSLTAAANELQK